MSYKKFYDYKIINDRIEEAYDKLKSIISKEMKGAGKSI
jgi:guanylate kinase